MPFKALFLFHFKKNFENIYRQRHLDSIEAKKIKKAKTKFHNKAHGIATEDTDENLKEVDTFKYKSSAIADAILS